MKVEKVYNPELTPVCYFRTAAAFPNKKVLLQITEKCNMHCVHCFVSSTSSGREISFDKIQKYILPKLLQANVSKVTLTGGEPLFHSEINKIIELITSYDIAVSICTNASLISDQFIEQICQYKNIHFNVSLDGFSNESHGKFRGGLTEDCFNNILLNIRKLGEHDLLNGVLVTPNIYSSVQEYIQLCEFATDVHAKYVLFNPLSEFGRGQNSKSLAFTYEKMNELKQKTQRFNKDLEIVYIRFPNDKKPLGQCIAGKITYIFTDGAIACCPYMVFAARDKISKYTPESFIIGNIFDPNCDIDEGLHNYHLPCETNELHNSCPNINCCTKGCMAAKISQGLLLSDCDYELCPLK